jgi:hypothetical protein
MRTAAFTWGLAGIFLFSGVAAAQSLGDVARKEEERRKSVKSTGKVYTNEDLRRYQGGPVPVPQPADSTPGAGGAAQPTAAAQKEGVPAPPDETVEEKGEAYWRKLITDAREQLRRSQGFLEAMQTRVNALTNDFYARDDPAQRAVIWTQRTEALEEMKRLEGEIAEQKKAVAAIQEDARRAGVPPGWLR